MRVDRLLLVLTSFVLLGLAGCSADSDGDGSPDDVDCAPDDPEIHPDATEIAGDGVDSNCDGSDNPIAGDDDDSDDRTDPALFDSTETVTGDWTCHNTLPDIIDGTDGDFTGTVEDFQEDTPVAVANVRIWTDNDPSGAGGPGLEATTDTDGRFTLPSGSIQSCTPFAARVWTEFEPPETYQTYQINIVVAGEPPFEETLNSVAYSTYQLLPLTVGVEPAPGQGIAAGRFSDCAGDPIANAEASVGTLDWSDGSVTEADGYAMRYFEDEDPEHDQLWISEDGLFGGMNVPPGQWSLLVWGIPQDEAHCQLAEDGSVVQPEANADYCLLGVTDLNVQPDSVNIANVELKPFPDSCYEVQ